MSNAAHPLFRQVLQSVYDGVALDRVYFWNAWRQAGSPVLAEEVPDGGCETVAAKDARIEELGRESEKLKDAASARTARIKVLEIGDALAREVVVQKDAKIKELTDMLLRSNRALSAKDAYVKTLEGACCCSENHKHVRDDALESAAQLAENKYCSVLIAKDIRGLKS